MNAKIKDGIEVELLDGGASGAILWLVDQESSVSLNPREILALGEALAPSVTPTLTTMLLAARIDAGIDICKAAEEIILKSLDDALGPSGPGRFADLAISRLRKLAAGLRSGS